MATIVWPIAEVMKEFELGYEEYEALPAAAKEVLLGMGEKHHRIGHCYKSWCSARSLENTLVDRLVVARRGVQTATDDIEHAKKDYSAARWKYIGAGGIDHTTRNINKRLDLELVASGGAWGSEWKPSEEVMQMYDLTTERYERLSEGAREALRDLDRELSCIKTHGGLINAMMRHHDIIMKKCPYTERLTMQPEIAKLRVEMQREIKEYDRLESNCKHYQDSYIRWGGVDYTNQEKKEEEEEQSAQKKQKLEPAHPNPTGPLGVCSE